MAGYGSLGGRGQDSLLDKIQDSIFAFASSLPCAADLCQTFGGGNAGSSSGTSNNAVSGTLKLNGRNVQIVKLLGEGGFSFVYLARDRESGREFALKKIRCPAGSDALPLALAELEAHRRFRSPNIMQLLDSAVVQDADGKTVYLFLPFHPMGNVQDYINKNLASNRKWAEKSLLEVFLGSCLGVKELHSYKLKDVGADRGGMTIPSSQDDGDHDGAADQAPLLDTQSGRIPNHDDDDDDEDEEGPFGASAAVDGSEPIPSYPPQPKRNAYQERQPRPSGEDLQGLSKGDLVPYAHRDIKPGNIMLSQASTEEGEAVLHPTLMDFGSTVKARVHIKTRRQAIAEQDVAAERSSMAYRAPELFDIKTDTTLTEAVDIWSLGCTLYCMMYSYSPFETPTMMEQGGSVAMAVLQNNWKFPTDNDSYSQATRKIIERCLVTKVEDRAKIDEVIKLTQEALRQVS
ncbi:kinase-like protein [Meira miltonrushii]|uniref:non-specific serine/threonine protein kinase n=1 Tax=Meira miltonrushii TaxID=1280837 RepID=A0A316VJX3_9BASI|nr:kinase-like protein [Meira miltonrushii]PWN37909.1 kinase-like protein [Meira miltonrushii]